MIWAQTASRGEVGKPDALQMTVVADPHSSPGEEICKSSNDFIFISRNGCDRGDEFPQTNRPACFAVTLRLHGVL